MCGIAGFLGSLLPVDEHAATVLGMTRMLHHRGPDESGYYVDGAVALGSARLVVIDEHGGKQPLSDPTARYWVVYNGEVYNYEELRAELSGRGHTFLTRSDTEVVLRAWIEWREQAFRRFNGGFAVAVYDRHLRQLVLARDRFGKRPLYYVDVDGTLVFASEMKAFLRYPGADFRWDAASLASIFRVWTPLPDQTAFEGIHQVPPRACLVADASGRTLRRYADLELQAPPFGGGEAEAVERTREVLRQSVRLRLRSDVEVGAYLSGGLDSSIVTALAVQHATRPVRTFSVGFEEADYDERADQEAVSRHLGTRHAGVAVSNDDIGRWFPEAVWFAESPVFRTAIVPMFILARAVHEAGVRVILTGEGADEVFLGYDIFKETLLRRRWSELAEGERHRLLAGLYPYLRHFRPENVRALAAVFTEYSRNPDAEFFSHDVRFGNSKLSLRLLRDAGDGLAALRAAATADGAAFSTLDPVGRTQWLELQTLLGGYLLSAQGDRMAMSHAVENRCPFLDPDVVAWASALPLEMRLRGLTCEKYVLKAAFGDRLPPHVAEKPKRPYQAPDTAALASPSAREYLDEALDEKTLREIPVLDADFCRRLQAKVRGAPPAAVSPRDAHAFVLLVSVSLLDRLFVRRAGAGKGTSGSPVVHAYDARGATLTDEARR